MWKPTRLSTLGFDREIDVSTVCGRASEGSGASAFSNPPWPPKLFGIPKQKEGALEIHTVAEGEDALNLPS